ELFNKSSKDKNLENLNETSIDIVHRWAKQVIKNHKNEDYYDNELFEDPLLLIEWFI
ncbi:9821_t:CDS:2, partial [Rhizophagus irregularis]